MLARTSAVMVVVSDWRGEVMVPFMQKEKEEMRERGSRCFGLEGQTTHCVRLMHGRRERCGTFRCVDALLFVIAVSVLRFPKVHENIFFSDKCF